MDAVRISRDLAEKVADWIGIYGKCEGCNQGEEIEAGPDNECRQCFKDFMAANIEKELTPHVDTEFCPTCGQANE